MSKKYHVSSVCNALMDIVIDAEDKDLQTLEMTKGIMHLVDQEKQNALLQHFADKNKTVELGGSSMNAIRTLSQLGKKTFFAGMVSEDNYGSQIKERLSTVGIDSAIANGEGGTGTCVILVTPDGERTMNTHLGASRLYSESIIPHDKIAESEVFHFCGYQWDTNDQKAGIKSAIETAKKAGTKVSFDIADPFVVNLHKDDFIDVIKNDVDIVFANEEEAKILLGKTVEETAKFIADTGAIAVIKLGAKGAMIRSGEEVYMVEPVTTQVVDTTAAGDMFAAGFLHGYTSQKSLGDCGVIAASMASDVISRYGATVSQEALDKFKS